ncbi:MAG: GH3 auxin-responsive promoter family protein [Cyclobacteriaceae bacterium]
MEIFNSIITWVIKKRIHQIELFLKYPIDVQNELLNGLLQTASGTEYGEKYEFKSLKGNLREFQERVPIVNYEDLYPSIKRLLEGEQNILWPTDIKWFAKSSGTTNAKSKFIPVSPEALEDCHYKGGKDMLSIYMNNYPDTKMFTGKGLTIGGSHQINKMDKNSDSYYGDVSAVIMKNLPIWAKMARTPNLDVALMHDWEEKLALMSEITSQENVTSISGVPTWTIVLIEKVLEVTGKKNILEVWPNLEVFVHGAVAFGPYRSVFEKLIPSRDMRYMETYNASEGFFGIQDQVDSEELLLMLDYGVFYEFVPYHELDKDHPKALTLEEVEIGQNYAMIITTNSGLWRYKIGDTVKFTSKDPYRIKITGRTKHFINAFGEELIIENADFAIAKACQATGASIENFTAGPVYIEENSQGGHEWVIEFKVLPDDREHFAEVLDNALKEVNSDYEAKRQSDIALVRPKIHFATEGTFYKWMKHRGKLGGQNKVPRLANSRMYLDEVLENLEVV